METRRLFLIFIILISFITLFAMVDLMLPLNTEGAHGAYFKKVKYPEITYQGEDTLLILVVYNENCTTNGEDKGSFFFKFYIDDDLWWNEYDRTDHKTWLCDRENWTARGYSFSPWYSLTPMLHNVKVELYWYDGNDSHLQDIAHFLITVPVYVEPSNLMIFSYVAVYLLAIGLLGFYISIGGRIKILPEPKKAEFTLNQQSTKVVSFLPKFWGRYFFLFFYLFVFASWQAINALFYIFSLADKFQGYLYLMVQITYVFLLFLVFKKENSSFREHGFWLPEEETERYISGGLLLAVSYSLVTIFVPGSSTGYYVFPTASSTEIFMIVLLALATSFASVAIFLGYIQGKLTKVMGFPRVLLTTSTMFALYATPFLPLNPFNFLSGVLSLFVLGVFLGVLFYRTKTLLCPIVFYFIILMLKPLVPIEPVSSQYAKLFFELVALALASLLLGVFTVKRKNAVSTSD